MSATTRYLSVISALLAGLAIAACGSADDDGKDVAAGAKDASSSEVGDAVCEGASLDKIGYSPLTMGFDYFRFTAEGMEQQAKACGIAIVTDDPQNDAAKQVSGIETMLTGGAGAVAITSVDPKAIETAVGAAKRQDAFVISQVSTFKGADVYVGLEEHDFGRLQGKGAGEALLDLKPDKDSYEVAILNADSLGSGLLDRKRGLKDGLDEAGVKYDVVADIEAYEEEAALTAVEDILQANPTLDLILTVNDPGSLGARSGVKAAGKKLNGDVVVGGLGIDKRVLQGVLKGDFPQSVSPEPVAIGQAMVRAALDLSAGRSVEKNIDIAPVLITKENAQEYLDNLYPKG